MADPLIVYIRQTLPTELGDAVLQTLQDLEQGKFLEILSLPLVQSLLGHGDPSGSEQDFVRGDWVEGINRRLSAFLDEPSHSPPTEQIRLQYSLLVVAISALHAFLQSNVAGPPLPFDPAPLLLPEAVCASSKDLESFRQHLRSSLSLDGEAVYKLTPHVELLYLSRALLQHPALKSLAPAAWARLRTEFTHQRLLSENSSSMQKSLFDGLDAVDELLAVLPERPDTRDVVSAFLLEKAAIYIHHGLDLRAREVLDEAAKRRRFAFALTGVLGKRTRYQEKDTSQLVVLASSDRQAVPISGKAANGLADSQGSKCMQPHALDLNDDTVLENIAFTKESNETPGIADSANLPSKLSGLDPSNQPQLDALDSIILLSFASSITNTRPTDGLTREETLPYAQRVLSGGSSNWQVYTQALLIRSRIEAHRSRTTERGLLQLQALVDQVVADTTAARHNGEDQSVPSDTPAITINGTPTADSATTFLPKASATEAAPASERLLHIHALASPTRWELEAELAARWVSLGGLRSALDIYERLEMWAEAALCWAATERDDMARRIVRRLLFLPSADSVPRDGHKDEVCKTDDINDGPPREPPPNDAPRLYCILGDLEHDLGMYERAWEVSGGRYARAQRSIGRHWFSQNTNAADTADCLRKAAAAYSKSLHINQLHQPSWFALGCALLELQEFEKAAEVFARVVQLDETDAESWSNLATALLKKGASSPVVKESALLLDDEEPETLSMTGDPQQNIRAALRALRRAATLKHDSARIWDNLITVALSLSPPSWSDILTAQRRIIAIRGAAQGEACIDVKVLQGLTREIVSVDYFIKQDGGERVVNPAVSKGLPRLFLELLQDHVTPLITTSPRLWRLVSTVALWRARPGEAMEALEKGWRAAMACPGWEDGDKEKWDAVALATIELADGYESLGDQRREASVEWAVERGSIVAKDWKFKARSAIRGVLGKAKNAWAEDEEYGVLRSRLDELKP